MPVPKQTTESMVQHYFSFDSILFLPYLALTGQPWFHILIPIPAETTFQECNLIQWKEQSLFKYGKESASTPTVHSFTKLFSYTRCKNLHRPHVSKAGHNDWRMHGSLLNTASPIGNTANHNMALFEHNSKAE